MCLSMSNDSTGDWDPPGSTTVITVVGGGWRNLLLWEIPTHFHMRFVKWLHKPELVFLSLEFQGKKIVESENAM